MAQHAFNTLCATLGPSFKPVLYFDEAHTLMVTLPSQPTVDQAFPSENLGQTYLYDILCSALECLDKPPIVLFLSTASHLYQLAQSGSFTRSARARSNIKNLQAPITETPFDCFPDFLVQPRELTLENTCDIEFMSQFGRPL
jgi:hypothetical protein